MEMEKQEDVHTKDGTTDIRGNPAIKKSTGRWRACPYILANECCERLAYYGMSTNLVTYMEDVLHQGSAKAATNVTNWSGTCYATPILGAFLADSYLGRFWTIATFMIIYIIGLALLTLSASVKGLKPSCHGDACIPTGAQAAAPFVALYLIALGTGGIKPCVSSFGADQFDDSDESEKKSKSSFFNWFYFSINIGALVASSVLVWVQTRYGWSWGFGIPAVVMAIAVVSFFLGSPLYRHQRPGGSPIMRIAQVLVASCRKYSERVPDDKSLLYEVADDASAIQGSRKLEHTEKLACLDKAAIETDSDRIRNQPSPWRLCTVTQVEELKVIVHLLPIWASGVVFSAVYSQMNTMFVLQGKTMEPHMGSYAVPAASLSLVDTVSVIMWVPIYDSVVVPLARRVTGNERGFTQLTRMGIGLVISIFAMLAAGVVEVVRLRIIARDNLYGPKDIVPMSIFWQVPQYFIVGMAEIFTFIGQLEFYYDQAPDAMRSMCSALSLTTNALGNYLSTLLVTVVMDITARNGKLGWIPDNLNKGHLDYFFWLLAVLSLLNFGAYILIAKWYTYTLVKNPSSFPGTRSFASRRRSKRCFCNSDEVGSGSSSSPEGDKRKQELLARIAMLQTQKVRLTDFLDERSAYLTQFAEDANAEFDEIGGKAMKELDHAGDRIMEKLESRMQAFEESADVSREEIEKNEKVLEEFEDQIQIERNEGLFFKNLGEKSPKAKTDAKVEAQKIIEITKENAGSKVRRKIYLALMTLLAVTIANAILATTEVEWGKVAALMFIFAGLLAQFIYERSLSMTSEAKDNKDE